MPILVTLIGISILLSSSQLKKALSSMLAMLLGSEIDEILLPKNAYFPISVTLNVFPL